MWIYRPNILWDRCNVTSVNNTSDHFHLLLHDFSNKFIHAPESADLFQLPSISRIYQDDFFHVYMYSNAPLRITVTNNLVCMVQLVNYQNNVICSKLWENRSNVSKYPWKNVKEASRIRKHHDILEIQKKNIQLSSLAYIYVVCGAWMLIWAPHDGWIRKLRDSGAT